MGVQAYRWRFLNVILVTCTLSILAENVIRPPESKFKLWEMPTFASMPCDVTEGPDGVEWTEELAADNLVRLNPDGTATEYAIPFTLPAVPNSSLPVFPGIPRPFVACGLDTAPDGLLYAINGYRNQIVAMNVTSKVIKVYTAPNILGDVYPLSDLTPTPDAIYFTQSTGNSIGRLDYQTHEFKQYTIPTPASLPIGVFYASDGGVWFTEFAASKVGRLDVSTGHITEYDLPAILTGPMVMRAETENRYLWFAATLGGSIGRVDMDTGKITGYKIPGVGRTPVEVCPDSEGNIWYSYITQDRLGKFDPKTEKFMDVIEPGDLPPNGPVSTDPQVGDGIYCRPGKKVWFSQQVFNRAGYYEL